MINIIIAGVGGQGLVLASKILSEVAFKAGYDVKTNDVVGLSQRGGKVWSSVKFGEKVHSPNILPGEGDIIMGMEPLEAYRSSHLLKKNGTIIINTKEVYPNPAILEKREYPNKEIEDLKNKYKLIEVNGLEEAREAGNIKAVNTVLIGMVAKVMDKIDIETWEEVLKENVPSKAIEDNIRAFHRGYELV